MIYIDDLGDYWRHEVTFEGKVDSALRAGYCIAGTDACPFEDCGDTSGFIEIKKEFRKVAKNSLHKKEFLAYWNVSHTWTPERLNPRETDENISATKDRE